MKPRIEIRSLRIIPLTPVFKHRYNNLRIFKFFEKTETENSTGLCRADVKFLYRFTPMWFMPLAAKRGGISRLIIPAVIIVVVAIGGASVFLLSSSTGTTTTQG